MSRDRTTADPDELDPVWRALSDPTRRLLLDELRAAPRNTMALVAAVPSLTRHAVISHIKTLEAAGLIRVERRGRERVNHLNPAPLQAIYERWLTPFEQLWARRLFGLVRTAELSTDDTEPRPEEQIVRERPAMIIEIVQQATSAAPPARVWETLTAETARWWTAPYVDEASLGLELTLEPGGTLFDRRSETSGYTIGIVRGYAPERELIIDGDFGVPGALSGRLKIDLAPGDDPDTTAVTFTHVSMGDIGPGGAAVHDAGWADLVERLCRAASG